MRGQAGEGVGFNRVMGCEAVCVESTIWLRVDVGIQPWQEMICASTTLLVGGHVFVSGLIFRLMSALKLDFFYNMSEIQLLQRTRFSD